MNTVEHTIPNGDGWLLSLFQSWDHERVQKGRHPVLIVPGYGMNSFIFSWHPRGLSLEGYLARAGFEVWRVDMRGQGRSRSVGGGDEYGLDDLAVADLGSALDAVLERTRTGASRVDVLGASLGGTIMFTHMVLNPAHVIRAAVAIGSPVRWVEIHPALKLAFSSPALAGMIRFRGTRAFAGFALPRLARRAPWLLSVYLNPKLTDTRLASEMVKTVEDPNPHVNRQIAHWIRAKDLIVRGANVTEGLRSVVSPLLCVSAWGDGIVPRRTAEFPYLAAGSPVKKLLQVGTPELAMAHADLFISDEAQTRVFEPISAWLAERTASS